MPPSRPTDLSALSGLAPELAEMLVSVACDIAVVLDEGGVIQSIAVGGGEPVAPVASSWVGRRWTDTVTQDTRDKAAAFLDDIASTGKSRLRHLNHESPAGSDVPVAYTAVRLGQAGPTLALGRDLRLVSAMQERLVQAQHGMERDYWRQRQPETRYRLLFQLGSEPVLVVDAQTLEILEANRAASELLGRAPEQLAGRSLLAELDGAQQDALRQVLHGVARTHQAAETSATLGTQRGRVHIAAAPFRAEAGEVLLLRLRAEPAQASDAAPSRAQAIFAGLAQRTPDAIVISNAAGSVILANTAFRDLIHLEPGLALTARDLGEWIGVRPRGLAKILETVRKEGPIRLLRTVLRREDAQELDIELSATLILDHDSVGFIIRASHDNAGAPVGEAGGDGAVH